MLRKFLICVLFASASSAQCGEISTLDKAIDAAIYRPAGLFATVLGSAVFAATLPMTAIASAFPPHDSAFSFAEGLVVEPAEFTFTRALGAPVLKEATAPHVK